MRGHLRTPISLLGCLLLLGGVFSAIGEAQESELVAFMPDTDWPPYLVEDDSEHPSAMHGLLPELFRAVLGPLGYRVRLLRLPNKRGWRMLDSGEVDLHVKAREWVPDAENYCWSDPLFDSENVLLFSRERPVRFGNLEDLIGLRVAVIGSFFYPGLDELVAAGLTDRVAVDSPYAMLELVDMGRADVAVVNRAETLWLFRTRPELRGERFGLSRAALDVSPYRFVFSKEKDWTTLIRRINERLAAMRADGSLEALLFRYR